MSGSLGAKPAIAVLLLVALFFLLPVYDDIDASQQAAMPNVNLPPLVPTAGGGATDDAVVSSGKADLDTAAPSQTDNIIPNRATTASSPSPLNGNAWLRAPYTAGGPDPRFDKIAIVVKTGKEVIDVRIPAMWHSWMKSVRHVAITGNANMDDVAGTGLPMVDVFHDAWTQEFGPDVPSPDRNLTGGGIGENGAGWKLDAHKTLPSLKFVRKRFPDADWYILADDDVYFFMDNIHHRLVSMDATVPHYIGSPHLFVGCGGVTEMGKGPAFGHGGPGIIISKAGLDKMLKVVDQCIPAYRDCFAGDVRVALCMRDAGMLVENPFSGLQHTVPPTPEDYQYPTDTCLRPMSFHHLNPAVMADLHKSTKLARANLPAASNATAWAGVTPKTHPDLFVRNGTQYVNVARTSPHFAPVRVADVYQAVVEGPYASTPDQGIDTLDSERDDSVYLVVMMGDDAGLSSCKQQCISDATQKCRSWSWNPESKRCLLSSAVPQAKNKPKSISGIVKGRYSCTDRTL